MFCVLTPCFRCFYAVWCSVFWRSLLLCVLTQCVTVSNASCLVVLLGFFWNVPPRMSFCHWTLRANNELHLYIHGEGSAMLAKLAQVPFYPCIPKVTLSSDFINRHVRRRTESADTNSHIPNLYSLTPRPLLQPAEDSQCPEWAFRAAPNGMAQTIVGLSVPARNRMRFFHPAV